MFGFRNIRTPRQFFVRIFIRPVFPFCQWTVVRLRILTPPDRQEFLLGQLAVAVEEAERFLRSLDFFPNRIAWNDPGQIISMRRLCEECSGYQYHIRIFEDGEVRGHYERTPEDAPLGHLKGHGFENRAEIFYTWIHPILEK